MKVDISLARGLIGDDNPNASPAPLRNFANFACNPLPTIPVRPLTPLIPLTPSRTSSRFTEGFTRESSQKPPLEKPVEPGNVPTTQPGNKYNKKTRECKESKECDETWFTNNQLINPQSTIHRSQITDYRLQITDHRLSPGDRPDYQKRRFAFCNRLRKGRVRRVVRKILAASEKPNKRPPQLGHMVPRRPRQHRILRLECIEHRPLGHRLAHVEFDFTLNSGKRAKMRWKFDADHRHSLARFSDGRLRPLACRWNEDRDKGSLFGQRSLNELRKPFI